jgi:GTPase
VRYRLGELVAAERRRVGPTRVEEPVDEEVLLRLVPQGPDFEVTRDGLGRFVVTGERVERWVQMLPLEDWEAVRYLQGRLRRAGVEKELVAAGARTGDDVVIGDAVFEFAPELEDLPAAEREALLAAEAAEELGLDPTEALDELDADDLDADARADAEPDEGSGR